MPSRYLSAGATAKAGAGDGEGGASALAGELRGDLLRARDEVGLKLDMGQRVLAAAEAAALRIACNEPLRRLLRRRPREATQALAAAGRPRRRTSAPATDPRPAGEPGGFCRFPERG